MGTVARLSATQFTSPTRQNSIVLPHHVGGVNCTLVNRVMGICLSVCMIL